MLEEQGGIVICAEFQLIPGETEKIREKMKELMAKRSASQPFELPSAGSSFKRPVGGFAAALIDQAGLKGYQIGGAAVSSKHAGFAVNMGCATAADVLNLLSHVSDVVFEGTGIRLEPEIRIW
jgi:UDP-N-acetylmuramate dehydrogenase